MAGAPLGGPGDADLEAIIAASPALREMSELVEPPAGCGRVPPMADGPYGDSWRRARALCFQRWVLVSVGFLPPDRYGTVGTVGIAGIERLQRALDVGVDGDWGRITNEALEVAVGFPMPGTRKWEGSDQPPTGREPIPPPPVPSPDLDPEIPPLDPEDEPVAEAGMGGLGIMAFAAAAYYALTS